LEKVISVKGKKEVAALTSVERGNLITTVICLNAVSNYIPPLIIWLRKHMKLELMGDAPSGSIKWACHPSEWIQKEIFIMWFDHFIKYTIPTATNPVLLILDGHNSHTKNIEVIEMARKNFVHIECLPPHIKCNRWT